MPFGLAILSSTALQAADFPDPDGKPADMSKPVKVFILMGQSNMVGAGKILGADKAGTLEHATKTEKLYPFLVDDAGNWTERKDVRNVRVMVGKQWDDDIANAKKVLSELPTYYPEASKFEVAGFFWWQGEKDCGTPDSRRCMRRILCT